MLKPNKLLTIALITTLLGVTAALIAPSLNFNAATAQSEPTRQPRTVSVSGMGKVTATPDVAYVTLGVEAMKARLGLALSEVNRRMAAVFSALEKAKVDKNDIRTVDFSIYPERSYIDGKPGPIESYRVVNLVRVKVRNPGNSGALLDAVLNAGANYVQSINFDVENKAQLELEARKAAIADAKAKAMTFAEGFGMKLGRVSTVNETETNFGAPMPMFVDTARIGAGGEGTVIAPGTQEITVRVQVTFELK